MVWFRPHLEEGFSQDPALEVCREVLDATQVKKRACSLRLYPMSVTDVVASEAGRRGVLVIGDEDGHQGPSWNYVFDLRCVFALVFQGCCR